MYIFLSGFDLAATYFLWGGYFDSFSWLEILYETDKRGERNNTSTRYDWKSIKALVL